MMDISIATSLNIATPNQSSAQASQSAEKAAESGAGLPVSGKDEPPKPKPQEVRKAAQQIQDFISKSQRQLEFHVDEQSGRMVITVVKGLKGPVFYNRTSFFDHICHGITWCNY